MEMLKDLRVLSLALIAAVGFAFEGLRHLQISAPAEQDDLGKAASVFAVNRDSVLPMEKAPSRRPKTAQPKISNPTGVKFDLASAISMYQKEHGLQETDTGAKKRPDKLKPDSKADKKKKPAKYEYVYDAKRGRWVKRLKLTEDQKLELQAKKRLEEMKKLKEQQEKLAQNKKAQEAISDSYATNAVAGQQGQAQNQNPLAEEEESQKSYDEWARLLLGQPSKVNLIAFIEAFRSNNVSSDVFYRIAHEMIEDPRMEMKAQGLEIADYFPSVQSFKLLVQLMDQGESSLYVKAEKAMFADYASLSGLNTLAKVMKTNDEQALIAATRMLNDAISKLLKPSTTPEPGKNPASYASNFSPFLTLLAELKEFGGELSSRATQTLALLQSSLGNQTVAAIN